MRLANGEVLLRWPLAQHIITAGWTYNDGSAHNAIDLRAAVGTPVYAAEDGTVDQRQVWDGHTTTGMQSYGNMVRIRHDDYNAHTLQTRYGHLSKICVGRGEHVEEGQLIGYSGATGNVQGAHLHFEVLCGGVRYNPLNWLDADFSCASSAVQAHLGNYISVTRPASGPNKAKLQRLCILGLPQDIADKARALALPVQAAKITAIGPASNGDAMTLWLMAQAAGCEYFARYTDDVAPNGTQLQRLAIFWATGDIIARAQAMLVPVDIVSALLIGPASSGDAMTLWGMAQAEGAEYFARYTN